MIVYRWRWWVCRVLFSCVLLGIVAGPPPTAAAEELMADQVGMTARVFLPAVAKPATFQPIPGASYQTLCMSCVGGWVPTDREPSQHADLNLALRGWVQTSSHLGLVDYSGGRDTKAPQLYGLFADNRTPLVSRVYRVYDWNWSTNQRGSLLQTWDVTLLGAATAAGEIIHVPYSGYRLQDGTSFSVMVLYATNSSITLKFTREDSVVRGYTLHLDGLMVDPALLSLYQSCHAGGRHSLPALRERQPFARAAGGELRIAIRDNGSFMDPRARKDWWYGR